MIWIGGAAALGTASHFNPTPFGDLIYSAMGFAAVLLTSATAVYAVPIARNPSTGLSPALKDAVVIGLALVLPLTLVTAGTMAAMGWPFRRRHPAAMPAACPRWAGRATAAICGSRISSPPMRCISSRRSAWSGPLRFRAGKPVPVWLFAAAFVGFVVFLFAQALMGRAVPALARMNGLELSIRYSLTDRAHHYR